MNKQPTRSQANAGFTLIEVIISIAVLSIASMFILQMFVTSAQLNSNARDIDQANVLVTNVMENFFLLSDPMALASDPLLQGAEPMEGDGRNGRIVKYYDEDWHGSAADSAEYALVIRIQHLEDGAPVPAALGGEPEITTALYQIQIEVLHLNIQGENVPLVQTNSTSYFHLPKEVKT